MKKTIITSVLALAIAFSGCNKWLDVEPTDRVLEKRAYNSEMNIKSILNGFYASLTNNNLYGSNYAGGLVDILAHYYTFPSAIEGSTQRSRFSNLSSYWRLNEYDYEQEIVDSYFSAPWRSAYKLILELNVFIKNVEASSVLSERSRNLYLGEAYGLRAMMHLDIYRLFGPVTPALTEALPYHNNPNVELIKYSDAAQYLDYVLKDLSTAEDYLISSDAILLNNTVNETNANEGTMTELEKFTLMHRNQRMNYWAVQVLKARTYMLQGNRDKVIEITGTLLDYAVDPAFTGNNTKTRPFGWTNPTNNDWSNNIVMADEVIFGPNKEDQHSWWDSHFDLSPANSTASPSAWVMNSNNLTANISGTGTDIAPDSGVDKRLSQYRMSKIILNTMDGSNTPYYVSYKYSNKLNYSLRPILNGMRVLIRLSEVAYMKAEAHLLDGQHHLAIPLINKVLAARGFQQSTSYNATTQLPSNATADEVRAMLDLEYYREFMMEGQAFFYLKRNNKTAVIKGYEAGTIPMTENNYVPGRPQGELDFYPNKEQE